MVCENYSKFTYQRSKGKLYGDTTTLIHVNIVGDCFRNITAELPQKLQSLQSLKHLLSGLLQREFINLCPTLCLSQSVLSYLLYRNYYVYCTREHALKQLY